MKMRYELRIHLMIVFLFVCAFLKAQTAEREFAFRNYEKYYQGGMQSCDSSEMDALHKLREYYHKNPYRIKINKDSKVAKSFLDSLTSEGRFSDMIAMEEKVYNSYHKGSKLTTNDTVGLFIREAYERIFQISAFYRFGNVDKGIASKVLKAIIHYGEMEIQRPNVSTRFHASCFAIPTAAVNTYFMLLDDMNRAENGKADKLLIDACTMLKVVALQAWTQPLRNDETDANVASIERFRNHVWWVGANGIAYRSLLPVAVMLKSISMIELVSDVCQKSISTTSQNTINDSFWIEGLTSDGAGWGHGKQCCLFDYPMGGLAFALLTLQTLQDTPWHKNLTKQNTEVIMNYLRGGSWYYYNGFVIPGLNRYTYDYKSGKKKIPYSNILNKIVKYWMTSFTKEQQEELLKLKDGVDDFKIRMDCYNPGSYTGIRWFYNNDDLIKKTQDYHVSINMASVRAEGVESALFADNYNFHTTDGVTLFQRKGDEYQRILGGVDVTALPGTTAREGMDKLIPVTNWRGYCSKHNFAGAATDSKQNAVAGYIFEKMNGSDKEGVNDKGDYHIKNDILYGFKAYKGYFILGDYFIALGAGITNYHTDRKEMIRTTIDQTSLENRISIIKNNKEDFIGDSIINIDNRGKDCIWIKQQGQFSYCAIPEYTSNISLALENKKTYWSKLNPGNIKKKNLPETSNILRIWTEHGVNPKNEKYGYVVYTGNGMPDTKFPFEVLRNDTLVQAVRNEDQNIIQAVFYPDNNGLQWDNCSMKVSSPCVVMLNKEGDNLQIYVADATMNPLIKQITMELNGEKIIIDLPQKDKLGDFGSRKVRYNGDM